MRIWNELSGGVCSTAQALLFPKIPNVIVNTGGNLPTAWRTVNQLRKKRITIITLSSAVQGYPTYYDYIRKNGLVPFYVSCCEKGKERHLNRFFKTIGPVTVNVGFTKGEEARAERLKKKNCKWYKFQFPMLKYTREQCEKILRFHDIQASKTGCWFCPKGPNPPRWAVEPLEARALKARTDQMEKNKIQIAHARAI